MADLGFQLKTHLYNMLTNNLTWEYMDQIEKWKLYIENVADMAKSASDSEVDTLRQAAAEVQAAREAAFARAMFLINLIAIPAVSWLGAAVKLKWAPKLTATSRTVVDRQFLLLNNRYLNGFTSSSKVVTTDNPMANQVLGDIGKAVGGFVVDLGQKNLKTSPQPFQAPDTGFVKGSNDWQSYRTGLMTALYDQQKFGRGQIRSIANAVENDAVAIGEGIVARLYKERPDLKQVTGANADSVRYLAGAQMINKMLNAAREIWANDWFYYGNDPPKLKGDMPLLMERELWALWVLDNIVEDRFGPRHFMDGTNLPSYVSPSGGVGDDFYILTKAVLSRLSYLAVPLSPTTWQALAAIDSKLKQAITEIDAASDTNTEEAAEETILTGLGHLVGWAKGYVPELTPMDYGVPRGKLAPIETYTGLYAGDYQH
jgi:hypothetical protein